MAYSSKSEMTVFEIQTRDICTPPFPKRVSTIGFCLVDWSTRPQFCLNSWLVLSTNKVHNCDQLVANVTYKVLILQGEV